MSTPFDTSLRRDPHDPRPLAERIEALVRERIEEAVEFVCMDLLVQLRRAHSRPSPQAGNASDREEFQRLVRDLLLHLRAAFADGLPSEDLQKVSQAEDTHGPGEVSRLLAGQTFLARTLPDYWRRFETFRGAFTHVRLSAPSPRPGLFDRLRRRS